MNWPSTYDRYMPEELLRLLPWPWASLIYFSISMFVLPVVAGELEFWSAQNKKSTGDSAKRDGS